MKNLFYGLFLGCSALHAADDYLWAKSELPMLKDAYRKYIVSYPSASAKNRARLDAALGELAPTAVKFTLPATAEIREIPAFRFFTLVDPITGEGSASDEEKMEAAVRDSGVLDAFTAMTALLEGGMGDSALLAATQKLMLGWALRAADSKTKDRERKQLSASFAFMVSEIGRRPALLRLAPVYRTRRAFLLETPEAAVEEAARIEALIKEISAS